MNPETPKRDDEGRELLEIWVRHEVARRKQDIYDPLKILPDDPKSVKEDKARLLFVMLQKWAADPVEFIRDCAWISDPGNKFGSGAIPKELEPPHGMTPVLDFQKQVDLIRMWKECLDAPGHRDLAGVKSRQVAMTWYMLWLAIWAWLFRRDTHGVLTTYKLAYIDAGGKGQRSPISLFGRLRLALDALFECIPAMKFNQHIVRGKGLAAQRTWQHNKTGMTDAQDVSLLLTRPAWVLYGNTVFPEAEGNTLKGELPSESTARSITATYVYFDEIGQYYELGDRADFKAWHATGVNVKCRFAWGTITPGGGQGTLHHELMEKMQTSGRLARWWCHWSDLQPYMKKARWRCRTCNPDQEPWDEPRGNVWGKGTGPGESGEDRVCEICGGHKRVRYRDMWSAWFAEACEGQTFDKVSIACELQMDWLSAQGDRLFEGFDLEDGVRSAERHTIADRRGLVVAMGVDPGHSVSNPGALQAALYNPARRRFEVFGYWMVANVYAEFFVPFLRMWTPRRLRGATIQRGKYAGERFTDVWDYSDDAMRMLDHMASFAGVPLLGYGGDKYGTHRQMSESPYERLEEYNIFVQSRYTTDREILVRRGAEWAARTTVHSEIAELRPMSPLNRPYPTAPEIFVTAKPKPHGGQGVYKLEVDKQDPPHVNNGADAWFYLCRLVDDEISASVDAQGGWDVIEERESAGVVEFGDASLGF